MNADTGFQIGSSSVSIIEENGPAIRIEPDRVPVRIDIWTDKETCAKLASYIRDRESGPVEHWQVNSTNDKIVLSVVNEMSTPTIATTLTLESHGDIEGMLNLLDYVQTLD